jgi:hypothetical protein
MKLRTSLGPSPAYCALAALLLLGACSNEPTKPGAAGTAGTGSGASGTMGTSTGTAGGTSTGTGGDTGASGTTGSGVSGTTGTSTGTAGSTSGGAGATGAAGSTTGGGGAGGGAGVATGTAGAAGGTTGAAGASTDPPPPRPINVTGTGVYQGNGLRLDKSKKIMGKLVLYLGGICGGTGAGGIESFVNGYGFHTYAPATQTCVNGGDANHAPYRTMLTSTDPAVVANANRIVGDARMELWDGVDRVPFVTVAPGKSIQDETIAALKAGMTQDPGGDWGYFLNADGTLRTTDVWVVGYSWGSQTWAMISSYVRFGRVICTSGPQAEGFPNADWILKPGPNRTPPDRQFTLLGFNANYPSMDKLDTAPNTVTSMIDTTTKAGWLGPPINVHPGDLGPFAPGHQIAMVGSDPNSPGGHTVFCTNNPKNGWIPVCQYVFGVQ